MVSFILWLMNRPFEDWNGPPVCSDTFFLSGLVVKGCKENSTRVVMATILRCRINDDQKQLFPTSGKKLGIINILIAFSFDYDKKLQSKRLFPKYPSGDLGVLIF